jgi:formylmethanofuran dehydrogenase subunit B
MSAEFEDRTEEAPHRGVTCPFCGLACDDLAVSASGELRLLESGCARAADALAALARVDAAPAIEGRAATLSDAVGRAASLLAASRQPVFAGMATDVAGTRALLDLADRCGAVVDHMNSTAKLRNLLAVQSGGWITTTLAEVRNRADLLVFVGTDAVSRFPRFFERLVWNVDSLAGLDARSRAIAYLGEARDTSPGTSPDGRQPLVVPCANATLPGVVGALRARLAGRPLSGPDACGVPLAAIDALRDLFRAARYAVLVWAAPDFDFPHAELTVQSLADLVKELNVERRAAALPLGGSDGDITMNQVHTWQTGYPFRTSLASGHPVYDPVLYSVDEMLVRGGADFLLWVSSFDPARAPPPGRVPTVVLGHAAMRLPRPPEVFIPVATPGVDHGGHFFRTDKVVALPLRALRPARLPSVAAVARDLGGRMPVEEPC